MVGPRSDIVATHRFVVFLNRGARTFSVTARMERARLQEVCAWAKAHGLPTIGRAARLYTKTAAQALKRRAIANYRSRGFTYVARPRL